MLTILKNRSLIDDFFNDSFFNENQTYNNYKFYRTENGYTLSMVVPGFNKDNLSVELDGDKLFIKGETKSDNNTLMSEMFNGVINKKFFIPVDVDTGKIDAEVTDGILSVNLPFKKKNKKKVIKLV